MPTSKGKRAPDIITALRHRGLGDQLKARAEEAHCTAVELVGLSRHAHINRARALLWLDMIALGMSAAAIGALFGRTKGTVYRVTARAAERQGAA